jgi:metal-sulfur cluster biosynthetic enzyme
LGRVLPASMSVETELVWEPEWTAERMSERARRIMGW